MRPAHALLIWAGFALAVVVPLTFAATSEYLAWRDPVYIAAGFSGVIALCVALVQPLLAAGWLPGLRRLRGRRVHRFIGVVLVAAVIVHVAGLWITSPPDIEDALLLRSPTPPLAAGLAHRPHKPCQHRRAWWRDPRDADRRHNGADLEGRTLWPRHCGDSCCDSIPVAARAMRAAEVSNEAGSWMAALGSTN